MLLGFRSVYHGANSIDGYHPPDSSDSRAVLLWAMEKIDFMQLVTDITSEDQKVFLEEA
jgi:hypothetical protein